MPINELRFGWHFACSLCKALNLRLLPVGSGSPVKSVRPWTDVSLHTLFPFCDTLPCLVCLEDSCSFRKTWLKRHFLLEIGALPPISRSSYTYLLQHLPLCFNCYFKSLSCASGMWVPWEQGPRFISGLNSVLSTGPGIEQVLFKFHEWMIDRINKRMYKRVKPCREGEAYISI